MIRKLMICECESIVSSTQSWLIIVKKTIFQNQKQSEDRFSGY